MCNETSQKKALKPLGTIILETQSKKSKAKTNG